jgi:O-antigen ligase
MLKANRKRQFVMAAMVFLLAIGSVEVVHTVPVVNEFVMGLFDRFSITADDGRQYLWASSFRLILNHPMGGGDALLEENLWAHNLPLDMGLLYGIPGFVIMTWLLALLVRPVVKWMMALRGGIEIFEVTLLSMFIAALVCSLISPPDIAFLTPLIMVGAFAKERAWMEASRAKVRPRAIGRTAMLAPLATN